MLEQSTQEAEDSKPSAWQGIGAAMNYAGMLITVVAVLKVVRHNVPGMEFGGILSFLVETYRATIYPIFDVFFGWLFRWLNMVLSDSARDIATAYLLVGTALSRCLWAYRRKASDVPADSRAKSLALFGAFLIGWLWLPILIGSLYNFVRHGPKKFSHGFQPFIRWGLELLVIAVGVILALLANLIA